MRVFLVLVLMSWAAAAHAQTSTIQVLEAGGTVVSPGNATDGSINTTDVPCQNKYYLSVGTAVDKSQVKATSGVLCGVSARNTSTTDDAFLKCSNLTAANTTPGTSVVFYSMIIPKGGSGFVDAPINAVFSVALTCYLTISETDNASVAVTAAKVAYNLRWK